MDILLLTEETVGEYIAAPKRATAATNGTQLRWQPSGTDSAVAVLGVEAGGAASGLLRVVAGYDEWRHWNLMLQWNDEQVYSWHHKPGVDHGNGGCPDRFPRKVRAPHEHVWVADHDLACALPLTQFAHKPPPDLKSFLSDFCGRINLTLEPAYLAPPVGDQMSMLPPPR